MFVGRQLMAKKRSYYEEQLAELLGLDLPVKPITIPKKQIMAIEELDVQKQREMNGIGYFLQAPELFSHRECGWCGAEFLVSRRDIAYCGYEHLKLGLNRMGVKWDKDKGFEGIVTDHFEGNEPIWIRRISDIHEILDDFEPFVAKPVEITDFSIVFEINKFKADLDKQLRERLTELINNNWNE